MDLLFNNCLSCPECGCTVVVREEISVTTLYVKPTIREHCHGGRWEIRTFLCGYTCQYIPNFSRVEGIEQCPNAPALVAQRTKRAEIESQIEALEDQLRSL